jgi:hypothetical protein
MSGSQVRNNTWKEFCFDDRFECSHGAMADGTGWAGGIAFRHSGAGDSFAAATCSEKGGRHVEND